MTEWMHEEVAPISSDNIGQKLLEETAGKAVREAVLRQASSQSYLKSKSYQGFKEGMVFNKGSNGLGYYPYDGTEACGGDPVIIDLKKDLPKAVRALDDLVHPTSKEQDVKRGGKPSCSGDPRASTPADQPSKDTSNTGPDRKRQKRSGKEEAQPRRQQAGRRRRLG